MERLSHRLFALGLSSTVAFLLNIDLIVLPVILILSYFIGSFPDMDLKWGVKHRGFTHTFLFFTVMTVVCTFGIFYLYYFFQLAAGYAIFNVEVVIVDGFPLPSFFFKIFNMEFGSVIDDTFFKMFGFFFTALLSHFLLDMITPNGLDVRGKHINGAIRSENHTFNFFFTLVGASMLVVSMVMIVFKAFTGIVANWAIWYFIIVGACITIIIILSLVVGARGASKDLRCFKLDNNIDICLPKNKCFPTGLGPKDKICNIDDTDMI